MFFGKKNVKESASEAALQKPDHYNALVKNTNSFILLDLLVEYNKCKTNLTQLAYTVNDGYNRVKYNRGLSS